MNGSRLKLHRRYLFSIQYSIVFHESARETVVQIAPDYPVSQGSSRLAVQDYPSRVWKAPKVWERVRSILLTIWRVFYTCHVGWGKKSKFRRSGRDFVVETSNRGIGIRQRRRYGILHSPLRVNYRKQLSILYLRYSTVFGYIYWAIKTPYNYSSMRCSQRTCLAASLMTASVLKIDCISGWCTCVLWDSLR